MTVKLGFDNNCSNVFDEADFWWSGGFDVTYELLLLLSWTVECSVSVQVCQCLAAVFYLYVTALTISRQALSVSNTCDCYMTSVRYLSSNNYTSELNLYRCWNLSRNSGPYPEKNFGGGFGNETPKASRRVGNGEGVSPSPAD